MILYLSILYFSFFLYRNECKRFHYKMGRWGLGFAWSGALIWTGDWTTQTTWPVSLLPFSCRDVANIVWNCSQWIQSYITGSHWLLWGHTTSNNKTVSCQHLWAGNIAKSMTSQGNSALLPANVNWQPPLQPGFMNFQLYTVTIHLKTSPLENSCFCFPQDQSLSVYY